MTTVLDEAQNIGGIVTAARRREKWQRQMANTTDDEKREALREAIADLEARFPELEEVGPGQAEGFARSRGHGNRSRSPVRHGRQRLQPSRPAGGGGQAKPKGDGGLGSSSKAAKGRKPVPGLDPAAKRTRSSGRGASSRPTPRVDKAVRQTRIPAAAESTTSATMLGLGATVGLALLYLVVSSAEKPGTGAAAVPTVIQSVTHWLGRFLSLADIFPSSPPPTAAAATSTGGAPLPSASEQRQAQREGKKLLPRLPELQPPKHRTRAHPIHFDPNNVQGAGR